MGLQASEVFVIFASNSYKYEGALRESGDIIEGAFPLNICIGIGNSVYLNVR